MGTNFYLQKEPPCECCGRPYENKHIGKSSFGWCFSLHVYQEEGIFSLDDWIPLLKSGVILDEYEREISFDDMISRITEREYTGSRKPEQRLLDTNDAQTGPNGLLRQRLSRWCVGHGEGTWDLIVGDFS